MCLALPTSNFYVQFCTVAPILFIASYLQSRAQDNHMQTYKEYIPDDLWDTFYRDSGAGLQYHVVRSFVVTCVMFVGLFLRQLECSKLIIEKKMLTKQQQQL